MQEIARAVSNLEFRISDARQRRLRSNDACLTHPFSRKVERRDFIARSFLPHLPDAGTDHFELCRIRVAESEDLFLFFFFYLLLCARHFRTIYTDTSRALRRRSLGTQFEKLKHLATIFITNILVR